MITAQTRVKTPYRDKPFGRRVFICEQYPTQWLVKVKEANGKLVRAPGTKLGTYDRAQRWIDKQVAEANFEIMPTTNG